MPVLLLRIETEDIMLPFMKVNKVTDDTYRFEFNQEISDHIAEYTADQKTFSSPLAKKLFGFPWTQALKVGPNFVELTKQDWVDWDVLLEPLQGLLEEHISTSPKEISVEQKIPDSLPDTLEIKQILQFIQDTINPSLAMHGGWVELKNFKDNTAYIFMGGGCQGCGMSAMTLKEGIQGHLKANFPFVQNVEDVTDHSSGTNPYFSAQ